mgnify:CR=1 FL=1
MEQFRSPDPIDRVAACSFAQSERSWSGAWIAGVSGIEAGQNGEVFEYEISPARDACCSATVRRVG